jgi:hypothetical protein
MCGYVISISSFWVDTIINIYISFLNTHLFVLVGMSRDKEI